MDPIQALEDQYFLLRNMLADLEEDAKATPAQIAALKDLTSTSQDNYWSAIRSSLSQNDAAVDALTKQLAAEQTTIESQADHLEDVASVLNDITTAVKIGSSLAAKIASVAAL